MCAKQSPLLSKLQIFQPHSSRNKEGWLIKRGKIVQNWKKRWFILQGDHLYYFPQNPDQNDKMEPLGVIPLRGSALTEEDIPQHPHIFVIATQTRKYYLQAFSSEEKLAWMDAIATQVASLNISKLSVTGFDDLLQKTKCNESFVVFFLISSVLCFVIFYRCSI